MNPDKLKKLQEQVRIGGKGTPRRKKKVVHATAATDDKKLQSCLKKLSVNTIPGIEEVNMIKDDGTVIHFNNPKAQASLSANTFAITGHGENRQITDMLPSILSQLGPEGFSQLKQLASSVAKGGLTKLPIEEDDDVPDLVENFDEASKEEVTQKKETSENATTTDKKPVTKTEDTKEKETKDKDSKDKESKENKPSKDAKESKGAKEPKEKAPKEKPAKEHKQANKDAKASKETKEKKDTKESKDNKKSV